MAVSHPRTRAATPADTGTGADALLDAAADLTATIRRAEADRFALAAVWAEAHPTPAEDDVVDELGDLIMYGDQPVTLAGEGAPAMAEFAIASFAAAIGVSTPTGRALIGAALECKHRLPRLWSRVHAGTMPVWKARRITERTHRLTPAGAAHVDHALAALTGEASLTQIDRAVAAAEAETDLERFEDRTAQTWEHQHFDIHLGDATGNHGLVPVDGLLDHADALALHQALQDRAHALHAQHPELDLDTRRAMALGTLADTANTTDTANTGDGPGRELVLHVHLDTPPAAPAAPFAPTGQVPTLEGLGPITIDDLYRWCTRAGTRVTLRPVLDLDTEITIDRYRPTPEQREQAILTCPTCVFPGCTRPARRADLDHILAYTRGGKTTS